MSTMQTQPTVLLEHVTRCGRHFDWLMGDPTLPGEDAPLWTARVGLTSGHWSAAGRLLLTELPAHRRVYLHRQGPIGEGRGVVRRVDAGAVRPGVWTADRRVLTVRMGRFEGVITLRRLVADRWLGAVRPVV
ncbi:hypothetical protein ACERK3_01810 [Phycisphaerales bacterium AB-hyl4]|uniref:Uncharacterized protein n=1 Tax=Natronomicrosphaera hydrolytica TaxID=3242702 RepID=A0ABV4U099_9BACT